MTNFDYSDAEEMICIGMFYFDPKEFYPTLKYILKNYLNHLDCGQLYLAKLIAKYKIVDNIDLINDSELNLVFNQLNNENTNDNNNNKKLTHLGTAV